MILRGRAFGTVFNAPGARGFYGEGYWFHRHWKKWLGMTWKNCGFVAKTVTLNPREGNMEPHERVPRCIYIDFWSGHIVNAVGLTNMGAHAALTDGRWQQETRPFMLSFMSVAQSPEHKLEELDQFIELLGRHLKSFQTDIALQLNFACPNVGVHHSNLAEEALEALNRAQRLDIPLVPNFSIITPVETMKVVSKHPACDALWVANTIPWGRNLPEGEPQIDWRRLFGSTISPLTKRGFEQAGGLSGPACLPILCHQIIHLRNAGVTKPIVGGNGIQNPRAVKRVYDAGASAQAYGSMGITRPFWMHKTIEAGIYHGREALYA